MRSRCLGRFLVLALLGGALAGPAQAQNRGKYGADFLAAGVGARALAMGGAYIAAANDVSAGYWNAAGLSQTTYPEAAYMHAERFSGIVGFDYGAISVPINARSTVGVTLVRSGVDDIPVTLNAFDASTGLPRPNPEDFISYISAADYGFFVTYARALSPELSLGASAKVIRRSIGDFANAWGYSFDVGAQYRMGRLTLGATLQDVAGMFQTWSVNAAAFEGFSEIDPETNLPYTYEGLFDQQVPSGGTEYVRPVVRLGSAYAVPLTPDLDLALAADLDLAFEGYEAYALSAGQTSFHPRVGGELAYKGVVALRAGLADFSTSERFGTEVTPTVGVGFNLRPFSVDYGFGDFAGVPSALGASHRISLRYFLARKSWARSDG